MVKPKKPSQAASQENSSAVDLDSGHNSESEEAGGSALDSRDNVTVRGTSHVQDPRQQPSANLEEQRADASRDPGSSASGAEQNDVVHIPAGQGSRLDDASNADAHFPPPPPSANGEVIVHMTPDSYQRFLEFERLARQAHSAGDSRAKTLTSTSSNPSERDDLGSTSDSTRPRNGAHHKRDSSDVILVESSSSSPPSQGGGPATYDSDDVPLTQRTQQRASAQASGSDDSARSRSKVSWTDIQRGYSGHRCPVCGFVYEHEDDHNPFACTHLQDIPRSQAERNWVAQFHAMKRAYRDINPITVHQPPLPIASVIHRPSPGARAGGAAQRPVLPTAPPAQTVRQGGGAKDSAGHLSHSTPPLPGLNHRSAIDEVRADERRARDAGVRDLGGSTADRRDQIEDAAHESDGTHSSSQTPSSSSWHPSTSESSLSSYRQNRNEITALRNELQQQRQEFQSAMASMSQQPRFLPPQMSQMPYMPQFFHPGMMPMPYFNPSEQRYDEAFNHQHQSEHHPYPQFPTPHPSFGPSPAGGDHFSGSSVQPGHFPQMPLSSTARPGYSPAISHLEQAGMKGAPEMKEDDLGKIKEFQEHVKSFNQYALRAVGRHEPHVSLAQTMRKHSFSLASLFTAQAMKRYRLAPHSFRQGDITQYSPDTVLGLSDEEFTRLYTECCSMSIEDPSQVVTILASLQFTRRLPEDSSPASSLMRAEAVFRSRLKLLPEHAVARCRPQELRDAFIKLVFTEARFATSKLDFQHCNTWEQAYQEMIVRAGNSMQWYSDMPAHPTASEVQVSPNLSSTSPAPAAKDSVTGAAASAAYWKSKLASLLKSVSHDSAILDGLPNDKKKAKFLQKLDYRRQVENSIRDQLVSELNKGQSRSDYSRGDSRRGNLRDPRDRSGDREQYRGGYAAAGPYHSREASRERTQQEDRQQYSASRRPEQQQQRQQPRDNQARGAERREHTERRGNSDRGERPADQRDGRARSDSNRGASSASNSSSRHQSPAPHAAATNSPRQQGNPAHRGH